MRCKESGYKEVGTILYNNPTFGMLDLSDDKGAQDITNLCKVHMSVHIYVQHPLSQPEYYDVPIKDETIS